MPITTKSYRADPHRWQYWNYSAPTSYFLTICTANRKETFGCIKNDVMYYSEAGKIVVAYVHHITTKESF